MQLESGVADIGFERVHEPAGAAGQITPGYVAQVRKPANTSWR